ncbi:MAG: HAD family phosphatase, partial [Planctomycetales bacterium]|nr:HAD family phosphatase [Planctomycetales bacterium]
VSFDPERACQNVAELAGVSVDQARMTIYESGSLDLYESGQLTSHAFWTLILDSIEVKQASLPQEVFLDAISDMFTPIDAMVDVVEFTRRRVGRIGVLSNTCPAHWNWVRRQPWRISQIDYDVKILSYEVRSMKPDSNIYMAAEQAARVRPDQILFVDDKAENVDAAKRRGWIAQQCSGAEQTKACIERVLSVLNVTD